MMSKRRKFVFISFFAGVGGWENAEIYSEKVENLVEKTSVMLDDLDDLKMF